MNLKVKAVKTAAAAGIILSMCTGVAFASIGSATVTADSLRMRSGAGTDSAVVTQAPKGAQVSVEEDAGNGWYKVTYGGKTGYMSGEWLSVSLTDGTIIQDEPTPQASEPEQQRGLITASVLNVRSGPDTTYDKVATLRGGMVVDIVADTGSGWYQIESGYVSAEYVTLVDADYEGSSSLGASAVAMAQSLLGCRYRSGASGPSAFDCSGFTYYIYKQLGHPIARGSSSQYYAHHPCGHVRGRRPVHPRVHHLLPGAVRQHLRLLCPLHRGRQAHWLNKYLIFSSRPGKYRAVGAS